MQYRSCQAWVTLTPGRLPISCLSPIRLHRTSGQIHLSAYDVGRRSFPFFLQIMILRISAPVLYTAYGSPEPRISHNGRREV